MNFLTYKPDSATKVTGFSWRIDDYLGIGPSPSGIGTVHNWAVTKLEKATGAEISSGKKLTMTEGNLALGPETLQVDPDTGILDESVNKLQRVNPNGEQNYIVPVGMRAPKLGAEYNF